MKIWKINLIRDSMKYYQFKTVKILEFLHNPMIFQYNSNNNIVQDNIINNNKITIILLLQEIVNFFNYLILIR